jgi:hypothetical protein
VILGSQRANVSSAYALNPIAKRSTPYHRAVALAQFQFPVVAEI